MPQERTNKNCDQELTETLKRDLEQTKNLKDTTQSGQELRKIGSTLVTLSKKPV